MKQNYYVLLKTFFIAIIFGTASFQGQAQSLEENYSSESGDANMLIRGKVIESSTAAPLELATLSLYNQADSSFIGGVVTDATGAFKMNVKPGSYYMKVEYISYKTRYISNVRVSSQIPAYNAGDIRLSTDTQALAEVEVVAERSLVELDVDKRIYNVAADPINAGSNAAQILDNLPSVQVDVDGNVSLRGSNNVRILIDGRPSSLTGLDNPDALRLLQGNLIEKVEVITNPSARYEAEGEVGIINIVLKKNRRRGLNGAIDINVGEPENFGVGTNVNYRKGIVNLFGSYSINYRRAPGSGSSFQRFFADGEPTFSTERDRSQLRGGLNNTFRIGADFSITKKLTLSTSALYRISDENNEANIRYVDFDVNDVLFRDEIRIQDEEEDDDNSEVAFRLDKLFERKGQKFTFDFKYIWSGEIEAALTTEQNLLSTNPPLIQDILNQEDERNILIQTDYVHPFGENAKFETGLRSTYRTIDNNYRVLESRDGSDDFVVLPDFANNFVYEESISAAYVILSNKIDKFSWQAGLRAEYTDIVAELTQGGNESNNRDFFNLFPSASFSYQPNPQNTYQISYSRRISRPRFWFLLPFPGLTDSRNFFGGNPSLDPELTHSAEISFLKNWKSGTLLASYYFRYRTGPIQRVSTAVVEVNDENTISRTTILPINLNNEQATGFEISLQQDIFSWWSFNADFNFYRSAIDGRIDSGQVFVINQEITPQDLSATAYTWTSRFVSKMQIKNLFDFQANAFYRAPRNSPQGRTKSFYGVVLGFSRDVLKNKGTLTLSVRDLFNSFKRRSISEGPNFISESEFQWRARQVTLNFNYRINQKKRRFRRGGRGGNFGGDDGGGF